MNINEKPGNTAICVKQPERLCPNGDCIRQVTLYRYNTIQCIGLVLHIESPNENNIVTAALQPEHPKVMKVYMFNFHLLPYSATILLPRPGCVGC